MVHFGFLIIQTAVFTIIYTIIYTIRMMEKIRMNKKGGGER